MKRINVHLYQSPMTHETRILKVTRSLAENGIFDEIKVVGIQRDGLPDTEKLDEVRNICRLKGRSSNKARGRVGQYVDYLFWMRNVYALLKTLDVDTINCHSVLTLPLGALLKRKTGCRLIYDTHELETETEGDGLRKMVAKAIEVSLIGRADGIFVVSDSIGFWYRERYSLHESPVTVRNVPPAVKEGAGEKVALKKILGLSGSDVLFIYVGLLSEGRNIGLLLDVFKRSSPKHIVFLGYGDLADEIQEATKEWGNIHYLPAVPPDLVLDYTAGADVGISMIANTCLSYYYCLPNKIWEYMVAGLPVMVSNFPEMRKVVEEFSCGWALEPEESAIAAFIDGVRMEEIDRLRANVAVAKKSISWQNEERKMIQAYRRWGC